MSGKRYPEEFKIEAVKQVVDRGYSVASVATRLDITTHSLYSWIKKYGPDSSTNKEQSDAQAEMQRSGMLSLMDAQARDTWYRSLEYDNFPEISEANILSTFEQLHQNKDEVFERGVINVFRGLSWNYKNNSPCKFGSKIIVNNLVRWDRWGFHLNNGPQADRLADLERMLHLFSGKPIPDNRENITIHLDEHIRSVQGKECYEDEMFSIRYFKKGSAHITFRKPELVDRLNDIIARHYPEMLPSQ